MIFRKDHLSRDQLCFSTLVNPRPAQSQNRLRLEEGSECFASPGVTSSPLITYVDDYQEPFIPIPMEVGPHVAYTLLNRKCSSAASASSLISDNCLQRAEGTNICECRDEILVKRMPMVDTCTGICNCYKMKTSRESPP